MDFALADRLLDLTLRNSDSAVVRRETTVRRDEVAPRRLAARRSMEISQLQMHHRRCQGSSLRMNQNFDTCLSMLLKHEGGFSNHKDDRGGLTNLGVTKAVYDEFHGTDMPRRGHA